MQGSRGLPAPPIFEPVDIYKKRFKNEPPNYLLFKKLFIWILIPPVVHEIITLSSRGPETTSEIITNMKLYNSPLPGSSARI